MNKKEKTEMNKKEKTELIDAFNAFAAEYENHVIECADTRTRGRTELANDATWQSLKQKMSALETGKEIVQPRCPKCGSTNVSFACVGNRKPGQGQWDVFCGYCCYEKLGFKSEKVARAAWSKKTKK